MRRLRNVAAAVATALPALAFGQQTEMEPKARCAQLLAYWDQRAASKGEGSGGSDMARKAPASIVTIAATATASRGWRRC